MITRSTLVVRKESEDSYQAVSFNAPAKEWDLGKIGIWIHSIVSRGIERSDLLAQLGAQFPDLSPSQADQEINELVHAGLLKEGQGASKRIKKASLADGSIGLLKVFFRDLQIDDIKEEYLLWVLWNLADIVYLVESESDADIVVCQTDVPDAKSNDELYLLWGDAGSAIDEQNATLFLRLRNVQTGCMRSGLEFPTVPLLMTNRIFRSLRAPRILA